MTELERMTMVWFPRSGSRGASLRPGGWGICPYYLFAITVEELCPHTVFWVFITTSISPFKWVSFTIVLGFYDLRFRWKKKESSKIEGFFCLWKLVFRNWKVKIIQELSNEKRLQPVRFCVCKVLPVSLLPSCLVMGPLAQKIRLMRSTVKCSVHVTVIYLNHTHHCKCYC